METGIIQSANPIIALLITFGGTWLISLVSSFGAVNTWWTKNKIAFLAALSLFLITEASLLVGLIHTQSAILVLAMNFALTWLTAIIAKTVTQTQTITDWWKENKNEFWYGATALGSAILSVIFGVMPK